MCLRVPHGVYVSGLYVQKKPKTKQENNLQIEIYDNFMDLGSNHQSVLSGFKLQLLSDSFDIFIKKSKRAAAAAPEMFSEI